MANPKPRSAAGSPSLCRYPTQTPGGTTKTTPAHTARTPTPAIHPPRAPTPARPRPRPAPAPHRARPESRPTPIPLGRQGQAERNRRAPGPPTPPCTGRRRRTSPNNSANGASSQYAPHEQPAGRSDRVARAGERDVPARVQKAAPSASARPPPLTSGVQRLLHRLRLGASMYRLLLVLCELLVVRRFGVDRPDVVVGPLGQVVGGARRCRRGVVGVVVRCGRCGRPG